jgi:hypothetical protein
MRQGGRVFEKREKGEGRKELIRVSFKASGRNNSIFGEKACVNPPLIQKIQSQQARFYG